MSALVCQLDRGRGEAARQGLVVRGRRGHHSGGTRAGRGEPPEGDGGEHCVVDFTYSISAAVRFVKSAGCSCIITNSVEVTGFVVKAAALHGA